MKLSTKLLALFLVISLAPFLFASLVSLEAAQKAIEERIIINLDSLASLQKNRIAEMIEKHGNELKLASSKAQMLLSLKEFLENNSPDAKAMVYARLNNAKQAISHFKNLFIVDASGKALISLDAGVEGRDFSKEDFFIKGRQGQFVIAPKFVEKASMPVRMAAYRSDLPIAVALEGKETHLMNSRDYRNEPVFASTRFIDGLNWGLVVKIDRAEALEPVNRLSGSLLWLSMLIGAIVVITAFFFSGLISRPIQLLHEKSEELEKGNFKTRVNIHSRDELEQLGNAFNKMAKSISDYSGRLELKAREEEAARKASMNMLEDLNESFEKLKELDNLKTEFVRNVSHELKTPLTVLALNSEQIVSAAGKKDFRQVKKLIATEQRNLKSLKEKIEGILGLSVIEAGKIKAKKSRLDLAKALKDKLKEFTPWLRQKKLRLKQEMPKKLAVFSDRQKAVDAMNNIIDNAIKFSSENGFIEARLAVEGKQAVFSVRDEGIGIRKEDLPKMFSLFFKASPNLSGTGIGLYIVKKNIEALNGSMFAESDGLGRGALVGFRLPLK
ncbi:sensor histidine kinase [archaeon]|nr:sensor histidine kinase [archaeon]